MKIHSVPCLGLCSTRNCGGGVQTCQRAACKRELGNLHRPPRVYKTWNSHQYIQVYRALRKLRVIIWVRWAFKVCLAVLPPPLRFRGRKSQDLADSCNGKEFSYIKLVKSLGLGTRPVTLRKQNRKLGIKHQSPTLELLNP